MKRRLFSKWMLALLIVVLFFAGKGTWDVYQKARQSQQLLELAQQERAELEAKQAEIEYRLNRVATETGIEEEIRGKFDVAREGEKLIVIVESDAPEPIVEEEKGGIVGFFTTLFSREQ